MVTTWRLAGHRTRATHATHATHVCLCPWWSPSSPGNRCLRLPSDSRMRCPNAVGSIKSISLVIQLIPTNPACHIWTHIVSSSHFVQPSNGGSDNDACQARQGDIEAYSLQRSSQRQRWAQEPGRPGETVDEEGQRARQDLSFENEMPENTTKHFAKWIKMICCRLVGRNFSKHFAHFDQWLSVCVPRLQSQSGATKNSSGCPSPGETSFAATAFHTISCDFNTLEQSWTHVISSFSSRLGGPVGRLVGSLGRPKYTVNSMATCCNLSGTSEY